MQRQKTSAALLGILAASMLLVNVGIVAPSVAPTVEWSKTYKGVLYTSAYSAEQTSDGGYIISGETGFNSSGSRAWLVRTDPSGLVQWNRTYGQFGYNSAGSVVQTSDGGYVFAGYQGAAYSPYPCFLVKTYPDGSVEWNRTYVAGEARCVRQTLDSGYILLCQGAPEPIYGFALLLKTDPIGDMQWNKTLRGEFDSVQETDDGGYILVGQTSTPGSHNALLLKADSIGNVLWNRTYGGPDSWAMSVQQTRDGGYIFASVTAYGTRSQRAWIVKVEPNGTTEWSKGCGTGNVDLAYLAQQTADGGYIVLGHSLDSGYWLTKIDSAGNSHWMRTFEKEYASYYVVPVFAQQTSDGGYMVAGSAYVPNPEFHELVDQDSFWLAKLTEYPSPISVATYLALALGTLFCIIAAVAIVDKTPESRRTWT